MAPLFDQIGISVTFSLSIKNDEQRKIQSHLSLCLTDLLQAEKELTVVFIPVSHYENES